MKALYKDRDSAAQELAESLKQKVDVDWKQTIVCGAPRNGFAFAKRLSESLPGSKFDIFLLHRFASLKHPELDLGAVTEDGCVFLNRGSNPIGVSPREVEEAALAEIKRLQDYRKNYCGPVFDFQDATVIFTDDGLSGHGVWIGAIRCLKAMGAREIHIALPFVSEACRDRFRREGAEPHFLHISDRCDETVYESATPVTDAMIGSWLRPGQTAPADSNHVDVQINVGRVLIQGRLAKPQKPGAGLVVFARSSSLTNTDDEDLSRDLRARGLGVLYVNLLDEDESRYSENFTECTLLCHRLGLVTEWISRSDLRSEPLGFFGSGYVAPAVIQKAAEYPEKTSAIVCRSGRSSAGEMYYDLVRAPVLIVDDEDDEDGFTKNQNLFRRIPSRKERLVLTRGTRVGANIARWFQDHM